MGIQLKRQANRAKDIHANLLLEAIVSQAAHAQLNMTFLDGKNNNDEVHFRKG